MSKQVEKSEEEKLSEFASDALRGPKFGIFEQLLCQHLVQATVSTEPLRKIQLIVEAALMVEPEKQEKLEIDLEKLEVVRAVTEAFNHRNEVNDKMYPDLVNVGFGFAESEGNYNRYIKPWYHQENLLLHYPLRLAHLFRHLGTSYRIFYCASCRNAIANDLGDRSGATEEGECKFCGANLKASHRNPQPLIIYHGFKPHDKTPEWKIFFAYCQALAKSGFNELKTNFLEWAMPFIMDLMRKLTEVVRPEIYNEIAKMFIKAREVED